MKIIFEFEDTDRDEAERAFRGAEYYIAIEDFGNWLRNKWKYDDNLTAEQQAVIEEVREEFYNIFGKLLDE